MMRQHVTITFICHESITLAKIYAALGDKFKTIPIAPIDVNNNDFMYELMPYGEKKGECNSSQLISGESK